MEHVCLLSIRVDVVYVILVWFLCRRVILFLIIIFFITTCTLYLTTLVFQFLS